MHCYSIVSTRRGPPAGWLQVPRLRPPPGDDGRPGGGGGEEQGGEIPYYGRKSEIPYCKRKSLTIKEGSPLP